MTQELDNDRNVIVEAGEDLLLTEYAVTQFGSGEGDVLSVEESKQRQALARKYHLRALGLAGDDETAL